MDYKIVEKESFKIVGKGRKVSTMNGENHRMIPAFWEESNRNGFTEELAKTSGPMGLLGVCMQFDQVKQEFIYVIGAEKMREDAPVEGEEYVIPTATWAVFESVGPLPNSIQALWNSIYSEWFPSCGYEHADAPELEVYPSGDTTSEKYRSEVWIPILKK
jgi:AraC family transcriptional regulator